MFRTYYIPMNECMVVDMTLTNNRTNNVKTSSVFSCTTLPPLMCYWSMWSGGREGGGGVYESIWPYCPEFDFIQLFSSIEWIFCIYTTMKSTIIRIANRDRETERQWGILNIYGIYAMLSTVFQNNEARSFIFQYSMHSDALVQTIYSSNNTNNNNNNNAIAQIRTHTHNRNNFQHFE